MSREVHVRFWESVEVRFLRATRLQLPTASPPLAPARYPEEQLDLFDEQIDIDVDSPTQTSPRSRAPPTSSPSSDQAQDWTVELDHDWGA